MEIPDKVWIEEIIANYEHMPIAADYYEERNDPAGGLLRWLWKRYETIKFNKNPSLPSLFFGSGEKIFTPRPRVAGVLEEYKVWWYNPRKDERKAGYDADNVLPKEVTKRIDSRDKGGNLVESSLIPYSKLGSGLLRCGGRLFGRED